MILSIIRLFQSYRSFHQNVRELSQLSDRELADIGVERNDIYRVAAGLR